MKDAATVVEYGVPIDPKVMIEPPDAAELELEAGHPGRGDVGYVKRRKGRTTIRVLDLNSDERSTYRQTLLDELPEDD